MTWSELTPSERCEEIARRFSSRRPAQVNPTTERSEAQKRATANACRQSALIRSRERRERLEKERPYWESATYKHLGQIKAIAAEIGIDKMEARKALWDLGLWPLVVRLRSTWYTVPRSCVANPSRSDLQASQVPDDLNSGSEPVLGEFGRRAAE